ADGTVCLRKSLKSWMSVVGHPYGTGMVIPVSPALKRWAKFDCPYGWNGFDPVAPLTLLHVAWGL
ncbi:MAG: hypothetical protein ABSG07_20905, partial [Terriglobales bacterium]